MNGIDAAGSLIASRIEADLSIAPGGSTTSQTGASALDVKTSSSTGAAPQTAPSPSAQTVLSPIALTLDAIARVGGEATPAVVGGAPIWPSAPSFILNEMHATASAQAGAGESDAVAPNAERAAGRRLVENGDDVSAPAVTAASNAITGAALPLAALIGALRQAVSGSGLFYEAHLAQWLSGQLSPGDVAREPQNRLVGAALRPALGVVTDGDGEPWQAHFASNGDLGDLFEARPDSGPGSPQSASPAVHAATIPVVRQQLDLLASGQFRWSGEAWPGAKFDWTIEQDGDKRDHRSERAHGDGEQPWQTRLTLGLRGLGTVDVEMKLTGDRLAVRVQANAGGAAQMAAQGEGLRRHLAAAGISLDSLAIREIDGASPMDTEGAKAAAAAYSDAAATGHTSPREGAAAQGPDTDAGVDWDSPI